MQMGRMMGLAALGWLLALGTGGRAGAATVTNSTAVRVEAAFDDQCESLVLREVPKVKKELLVAAYIVTRPNIVAALCTAAERKVAVKLKYDGRQAEADLMQKALDRLRKAGVICTAVKFQSPYALMHDKFIVIDRQKVLTGSFNYTSTAAHENYENLVLLDTPKIAEEFARAFDRIRANN